MQQSFKSLILVAVMGCFLIFMAGVLVKTETSAKKTNAKPVTTIPSQTITVPPGAPKPKTIDAKADPHFVEKLAAMRKILTEGNRADPAVRSEVMNLLATVTAAATTAEWSAVRAEAAKRPYPDGFETVLVAVAGATKHEEAVPFIVEHLQNVPTKAIDALRAHGSHAAFDQLLKIFLSHSEEGMRYLALGAFQSFPEDWIEGVHVSALTDEKNPEIRLAVVTQMRMFKSDAAADALALHAATLGDSPKDVDEALRTFNSLAGMKNARAHRAILTFFADDKMPAAGRKAAGQSLRFLIDPALVSPAIDRLIALNAANEDLLLYLGRNVSAADREALGAARFAATDSALTAALDALLKALPAN